MYAFDWCIVHQRNGTPDVYVWLDTEGALLLDHVAVTIRPDGDVWVVIGVYNLAFDGMPAKDMGVVSLENLRALLRYLCYERSPLWMWDRNEE